MVYKKEEKTVDMKNIMQNCVTEWSYDVTEKRYEDPFNDVELKAIITEPDGQEKIIYGCWGGKNTWRIRYSSWEIGTHRYRTICSDSKNSQLHDQQGQIEVVPYEGDNPLYKHGGLEVSKNNKYLAHHDGTVFYWLGDTWYLGLTKRLEWPESFQLLAQDRVEKGFSVIQIVAGLYCDMYPFEDRGANEAGFPWDKDFSSINPEYFDMADRRLSWLVDKGLMPCILGCWGFYIDFIGEEGMKKHWDYLQARYGAYPVVWCMAGETLMPFYGSEAETNPEKKKEYTAKAKRQWTEVTRHLRNRDAYHRLITVHAPDYGHDMLEDETLMDIDMLQTGHDCFANLSNAAKMIVESVKRKPGHPVINGESCYEGICGTGFQDVQRFLFWSCMLSGACGYTYGANGVWQFDSKENPYGLSPHGATWGNTPWKEAYQLPGSRQVGLGKKLLEKYRWWEFQPHPEWLQEHSGADNNYIGPYAAGIPGEIRIIFLPRFGGFVTSLTGGQTIIKNIEKDIRYRAFYYDPITGDQYDMGEVIPDEQGCWMSGKVATVQDWVLVLEKTQ